MPQSKGYKAWLKTRRGWFKEHKADSYTCYICETYLTPEETTLDHIKPRGSHPALRYELSNLAPCCGRCQTLKGSKSLALYIRDRDASGEHVSELARSLA